MKSLYLQTNYFFLSDPSLALCGVMVIKARIEPQESSGLIVIPLMCLTKKKKKKQDLLTLRGAPLKEIVRRLRKRNNF